MKKYCNIEIFETLFKVIYLIHIVSCGTNLLFSTLFTKITTTLVVGMALLILLYRMVHVKKYLKTPYWYLYCIFLVSLIITSAVNMKYGVRSNIKILIWMTIQFFCLCFFDGNRSMDSFQKEFNIVIWTTVILSMFFNAISIYMLFTFHSSFRYLSKTDAFLIGYAPWGRLYGAYIDPNYSSVFSTVALLSGFYLLISKKNILSNPQKWLIRIANVLSFLYITFGASRTAMVVLCVGAFSFLAQLVYIYRKSIWKAMLAGLVAAVMVTGAGKMTVVAFNGYSHLVSSLCTNGEEKDKETIKKIGRDAELTGDISNRRFSIWKDAIAIAEKNPVFGISFGNIDSYAEAEMPNAYIINNDFAAFNAFHNMFFDLAACQGIVGIISFGLIVVLSLVYAYRKRKIMDANDQVTWAFLFTGCLIIFCAGFFVSLVLYVHNLDTVLFWMLWGYFLWFNKNVKVPC